jgi:signal transduction histidine kinase/ActR/RegA family two-component response regulator
MGAASMAEPDRLRLSARQRLRGAPLRFAFAGILAGLIGLTLQNFAAAALWLGLVVVSQAAVTWLSRRVAERTAPHRGQDAAFIFLNALAVAVYAAPLPFLAQSGPSGDLIAILLCCGQTLHLLVSALHDKRLFAATIATPTAFLLWAVADDRAAWGEGSVSVIVCISLACAGTLVNLWLAFKHNAAMTEELERARLTAEAGRAVAEAADAAKTRFLAVMSHELRTPLNGVLGATELLRLQPLDRESRSLADVIAASGADLMRQLNDLLDMSKIEAGRIDIEAIAYSPSRLALEMERLWRPRAEEKGLTLTIETADLPDRVRGDPGRVRQVVSNLISNAIKFTECGGVRVLIRSARIEGEQTLVWTVEDTGVGIPDPVKGKVFEAFAQADETITRRYGGTGLGLAISKQLALMMGGDLTLRSSAGQGSVFALQVPAPSAEPAFEEEETPVEPLDGGQPSQGLRILVAEDHPTNRLIIGRFLEPAGHRLTMAENGAEAVEAARSESFDLVILDVHMPLMDGIAAAREIRALAPETPIVMLSADALPEHRQRGFAAGADDYLPKPIEPRTLFEAIARASAGRAAFAAAA